MLARSVRASRLVLVSSLALVAVAGALPVPAARAQIPFSDPYLFVPNPEEVELADTDGDGRLDLFVSISISGNVRVFLGQQDGSFDTDFHFVSPASRDYAVADLDEDGRADVVTVDDFNGLQVWLSLGGGQYAAPIGVPISGVGRSVAAADLDGDGDLDLVVGLLGGQHAALALGAGDGSFTPASDVVVPAQHASVSTGDINGDGDVDLVSWAGTSGTVSVEMGQGSALFAPPITVFAQSAQDLDVGDVNGDGADDLAILSSGTWLVLGQVGGLPLPPASQIFFMGGAEVIRIADVTDDGQADVALGGSTFVALAVQQDGGTFPPFTGLVVSGTGSGLRDIEFGDFDHDGTPDLVSAANLDQLITVHTGQGDGGFRPVYGKHLSANFFSAAAADLDLDGRLEVLTNGFTPSQTVWPGRFDASFGKPLELWVGFDEPATYDVSDSNGDGFPDVLAYSRGFGTSPAQVSISPGAGDLTFGTPAISTVASSAARGDFVDFDADGHTDILLVGQTGDGLARLSRMTNARTSFVLDFTMVFPSPGEPAVVEVVDLDEDGTLDAVGLFEGAGLRWLEGFPGDGYALPVALSGLPPLQRFALADLTGDGHLDVVGLVDGADTLLVAAGDGDATFGTPVLTPVTPTPSVLRVADHDGDGWLDVAVASQTLPPTVGPAGAVHLFRNLGAGQLALAGSVTTANGVNDVLFADTNRDGANELIAVCGNQVLVLLNQDGPWDDVGHPLPGAAGFCELVGEGTLEPGAPLIVAIQHAAPLAPVIFVVGPSALNAPFKGGTLVPQPLLVIPSVPTNEEGQLQALGTWPDTMPTGASLYMQAWLIDAGGPAGFSATNALRGTTP